MDRYSRGDDGAFLELYDTLAPRLYGFLARQLRDPVRAEDFMQQTFLQIHRARGSFLPGAEVMPWAYAIARRLVIDSSRRDKIDPTHGEEKEGVEAASPDAQADELLATKRLAAKFEEVLDALPENQRMAFTLIRIEGLSCKQAAEVLDISVSAVKLRAFRAYESLRKVLGEAAGTADDIDEEDES